MGEIDWNDLAEKLQNENGSSTWLACDAIELIIGHDNIKKAVDYYIDGIGTESSELIRGVLWQIHSKVALHYCYEIFQNSSDLNRRIAAVELMRVLADTQKCSEVLDWIPQFLADPDPTIQNWGIGVLDQLVTSELIDETIAKDMLNTYKNHSSKFVKEQAEQILQAILDKEEFWRKAEKANNSDT